MYKWIFLIFCWTNSFSIIDSSKAANVHPFYVSVCEVNQNASAKSLEISCKFFADDLEQVLEKTNKVQLDITLEKDKAAFDKYIPAYVSSHFQVTLNNQRVSLKYVGFEKEKESAYAYFEVNNVSMPVTSIGMHNNLLYDFTDQEINIMHVTVNGKRQSTKLDYPDTEAVVNF